MSTILGLFPTVANTHIQADLDVIDQPRCMYQHQKVNLFGFVLCLVIAFVGVG